VGEKFTSNYIEKVGISPVVTDKQKDISELSSQGMPKYPFPPLNLHRNEFKTHLKMNTF
jgi:hypothetical protein